MWGRKRLVQIELDHVGAHVARFCHPHQRVQICSVHVDQAALDVDQLGNLDNVPLKQPQGVGVGDHQGGDFVIHILPERSRFERAVRPGRHLNHRIAAQRGRRRVGAVGAARNQHLLARLAVLDMVGPNELHAGQLTLGASCGLEADRVHAADFGQAVFETGDQLQGALGICGRHERMDWAKPGRRATTSFTTGLYFMVHEPSGYSVVAALKFHCDSRVKWRTTSPSLTSGKSSRSARHSSGGRS